MGFPKLKPRYTIDQYLAIERDSQERLVFLDGEIYSMAGESDAHGIISVNLIVSIGSQLRGKACSARTKDTKVRSGPTPATGQSTKGMFSYPDLLVVCGEPEYHDARRDVLLNPAVIVEVLSAGTEAFDRGEKFKRYQTWNPTLSDYLLVSQDQPQIEHFSRRPDGTWTYSLHAGIDADLTINNIDCVLKLADVYERIDFQDLDQEKVSAP